MGEQKTVIENFYHLLLTEFRLMLQNYQTFPLKIYNNGWEGA